jgi:hypothetical protein
VGELLIISTLCEAIKSGAANATLEVRKSNHAARALYRKYGFNDIGIRRRYYADNREDAVIMATPSFANLDYMRSLRRRCDSYFAVRGKTQLHVEIAQLLALPEQEENERDEGSDCENETPSRPSLLNREEFFRTIPLASAPSHFVALQTQDKHHAYQHDETDRPQQGRNWQKGQETEN